MFRWLLKIKRVFPLPVKGLRKIRGSECMYFSRNFESLNINIISKLVHYIYDVVENFVK